MAQLFLIKQLNYCVIIKQMYIVFLLYEATRSCRASLEGPAFPRGSHVRLFSYSVFYYEKYFISVLNKIHKIHVWL